VVVEGAVEDCGGDGVSPAAGGDQQAAVHGDSVGLRVVLGW
jgi:hypothetical protein